jgi:DNA-binding IclR family transcriptional regulator
MCRMLAGQGMRPFTPRTATDVAAIESDLRGVQPGGVVIERGEFRDDVACASIATPADGPVGWWAIGVSARGLDLPDVLLTQLRVAAADLGPISSARGMASNRAVASR